MQEILALQHKAQVTLENQYQEQLMVHQPLSLVTKLVERLKVVMLGLPIVRHLSQAVYVMEQPL